jgi:hypothetical protein
MNDSRNDRLLSSALRAVAEDDEMLLHAPPGVEAKLLAEVRAIDRMRRSRRLAVVAAAAAVLFVAIALPFRQQAGRQPAVTDAGPASAGATREVVTEFFPLEYSVVPVTDGHVLRLQVPRAALASFGVAAFDAPDNTSATVPADVVVGNDGLARAVRFVRVVNIQEQEEQKP